MNKTTTNLLGIVITILAGSYFFMMYCSECSLVASEQESPPEVEVAPPEAVATSYPFSFKLGDQEFGIDQNFNFGKSSAVLEQPVDSLLNRGITELKSVLGTNESKEFLITGFYGENEENQTAFPNLGLARANAVKNFLVSEGVSSSLLNIKGELNTDMVADGTIFKGPLRYEFIERSKEDIEALNQMCQTVKEDPLVLYFNTGQAAIQLTEEQRAKIALIASCLDKVEGASCAVVGHTDNVGNRDTNIGLGQERADFVRAYLIRNGIPESKINSSSKGPDTPIASNATEEGRAANRRTVVTLN